jgi:hypothetical protein
MHQSSLYTFVWEMFDTFGGVGRGLAPDAMKLLISFWLLLYTHRYMSILGAASHIILTPANQLMVMGLKIWSLSNPVFEPGTF